MGTAVSRSPHLTKIFDQRKTVLRPGEATLVNADAEVGGAGLECRHDFGEHDLLDGTPRRGGRAGRAGSRWCVRQGTTRGPRVSTRPHRPGPVGECRDAPPTAGGRRQTRAPNRPAAHPARPRARARHESCPSRRRSRPRTAVGSVPRRRATRHGNPAHAGRSVSRGSRGTRTCRSGRSRYPNESVSRCRVPSRAADQVADDDPRRIQRGGDLPALEFAVPDFVRDPRAMANGTPVSRHASATAKPSMSSATAPGYCSNRCWASPGDVEPVQHVSSCPAAGGTGALTVNASESSGPRSSCGQC